MIGRVWLSLGRVSAWSRHQILVSRHCGAHLISHRRVHSKHIVTASTKSSDYSKTNLMEQDELFTRLASAIVPPLTDSKYKGQAGKVAVIGGCREYTGAPYFAAMAALRVGADLSHVFCTSGAAPVIKAYSPDLIVHPYLCDAHEAQQQGMPSDRAHQAAVDAVVTWLDKFQCVVVGPGLGRDALVMHTVAQFLQSLRTLGTPVVLDADALWLATQQPELIQGWRGAVLTPNVAEYKRLCRVVLGIEDAAPEELHAKLQGPIIVRKGPVDEIYHAHGAPLRCIMTGSPRRCGGQGDVLSGCLAVFCAWAAMAVEDRDDADLAGAAYLACRTARQAASLAFAKHKRSMVTQDVLQELGGAVQHLFPV